MQRGRGGWKAKKGKSIGLSGTWRGIHKGSRIGRPLRGYRSCSSFLLITCTIEQGIDTSVDIYHTMMDGYTMVHNEEKCLMVFHRLKECGFTPSIVTYGRLLNLNIKVADTLRCNN
ncbi:pentatricopeptide repeat-containing protein, chloroplastic-like protein [Salvia divinorum]|uniref:Pentatricopeptide repeat-containing protein, chloroplastic-like protein n=1 Tax=Salvia divinorum TaxID=28513 RepID=A0ABD1GQ40_SALDI